METMPLGTVTCNELTVQFPGGRRMNIEHCWHEKLCGLWGTVGIQTTTLPSLQVIKEHSS